MKSNFQKVKEFYKKTGLPQASKPSLPDTETFKLKKKLILQEWAELKHEMVLANKHWPDDHGLEHIAKEMADLLYEVYAAGLAYGIDLDYVFEKLHESNMSKGPNYAPPNMSQIIEDLKQRKLDK